MPVTGKAVPGKAGVTLLARVIGAGNVPIIPSSVASIAYTLTDLTTGVAVLSNAPITVSAALFANLQTDPVWTKDSAAARGPDGQYGYNFKFTIPAANVAPAGDRFQADVVFTPTTGENFVVNYQFRTVKNYL